jgi:RNA polymerase sigma factor (sigma-70 family)
MNREHPEEQRLPALLQDEPVTQAAWKAFLRQYSKLFLKIIWQFRHDHDAVMETYVYVCERLAENGCARLRSFDPSREATFSTWLTVVVRNLCALHHREEHGRRRYPKALHAMTELDRQVYLLHYWEGYRTREVEHILSTTETDARAVRAAIRRVQNLDLKPSRTWAQNGPPDTVAFEENRHSPSGPDENEPTGTSGWIESVLDVLSPDERSVVRLRFWGDLPASAIARLMEIPQRRVYTLVKKALKRMGEDARGEGGVK